MKKICLLIAALVAFSCVKDPVAPIDPAVTEPEIVIPELVPMTFSAEADKSLETKTSLEGLSIKWAAAEKIYLFDGTAPRAFTSDNAAVASTVNFTGLAASSDKYYAIFPSGTISGSVIHSTIPVFQTATANSFSPKANVAVAYTETDPERENALKFKNVGAVVKFQLSNSNVRKVRLEAIGGEKMTGPVDITFDGSGNFSSSIVSSKAESCAVLTSETDLSASTPYYFVINPGTYASGFRITLFKADGSYRSISNTTSNTLDRNDLMDFGTLPEIIDEKWKTIPIFFNESFSKYTAAGGNDDNYSGGSATFDASKCDETGWTVSDGGNVYGASNCVRIGKDSGTSFSTRALDLSSGNAILEFRAALFGSDNTTLSLSVDNGTITPSSVTLVASTWNEYRALITGGTAETVITFSPAKRCFLDDIVVREQSKAPADPVVDMPSTITKNYSATAIGLAGGTLSFDVESNVPWTVESSNPEFASISTSGATVSVTFTSIPSGSRDATITVSPSEGGDVSPVITQTTLETVSFTPGTDTGETTVTKDGVSALMTTMNNASYYQIYANKSGTFTAPSGKNITRIEFTCTASGTSNYGPGNASANSGEYAYSEKKGIWIGKASSVTISTTQQIRMSTLSITYF